MEVVGHTVVAMGFIGATVVVMLVVVPFGDSGYGDAYEGCGAV